MRGRDSTGSDWARRAAPLDIVVVYTMSSGAACTVYNIQQTLSSYLN
jgi:hypothetical protein